MIIYEQKNSHIHPLASCCNFPANLSHYGLGRRGEKRLGRVECFGRSLYMALACRDPFQICFTWFYCILFNLVGWVGLVVLAAQYSFSFCIIHVEFPDRPIQRVFLQRSLPGSLRQSLAYFFSPTPEACHV